MKNDKIICAAAMLLAACVLRAEVAQTNGYTWTYRVQNGKAIITDFTPEPTGRFVIPGSLDGYPVEELGAVNDAGVGNCPFSYRTSNGSWRNYRDCTEIVIPEGVRSLNCRCFESVQQYSVAERWGEAQVSRLVLPSTLRMIADYALSGFRGLSSLEIPEGVERMPVSALPGGYDGRGGNVMVVCPESFKGWDIPGDGWFGSTVVYLGKPLQDITQLRFWRGGAFRVSQKYFDEWMRAIAACKTLDQYAYQPLSDFRGIVGDEVKTSSTSVTVLSGGFRKGNPRVYDLVYRVNSDLPNVKVRAVGVVETLKGDNTWCVTGYVRPSRWIEGTAVNVGDAIRPGVDHKLSWQISDSECGDIGSGARLRVQVLASSGELVPFHAVSLPSTRKMVRDDYGNVHYTGTVAMKVSLTTFTDKQLTDALLYMFAAGDDSVKDYLPKSYDVGYGSYMDVDFRRLVAKECGYTCLSELELSGEDREAIWNRLNEVFFRSPQPLYNGWSTNVGIDPFVKFE